MKYWELKARPVASCLATKYERERLQRCSITVRMKASQMGRNNRNKMMRMVMPLLKSNFGHICKIGGFNFGEPMEIPQPEGME